MDEDSTEYKILKDCDEEEIFRFHNGLGIMNVRDLAVQLKSMDTTTFHHHVTEGRNDFTTWIKNVFDDQVLADQIAHAKTKLEMAKAIEQRLLDLEEKELTRYGISMPMANLELLEKYIESQLTKGKKDEELKKTLINRGWSEKTIDLLLAVKANPYKGYKGIDDIENVSYFHEVLEKLKKHLINAVADGRTIDDLKEMLRKNGWHEEVINFIFYDIFKPHPNIRKLSTYIIDQVKFHNKSIEEVKRTLLALKWKEYIIDSVIYGVRDQENSVAKILSYLEGFSNNKEDQVKVFLLQMGWDEPAVNEAIQQKELETIERELETTLNLKEGTLIKEQGRVVNNQTIILSEHKASADIWKRLLKSYTKISLSALRNTKGELHADEDYYYCYAESDIRDVERLEGKPVDSVLYQDAQKPLLIEMRSKYLILPSIIRRPCVMCGGLFGINELKQFEMWDDTRTHKVTKYVCQEHEKQMKNFLEKTRIVQE